MWLRDDSFWATDFLQIFEVYFRGKEGGSRVARMPTLATMKLSRRWGTRFGSDLADGGHGGAEEGFEVVGGFGVLGDGGFYGLLGYRARVAQVDEGG